MKSRKPSSEIIKQRYSCRSYQGIPLEEATLKELELFINSNTKRPFNTDIRFKLVSAAEGDSHALRGLGTYGFIKNPAGFVVGAMKKSANDCLDFGYLMEKNVLFLTELGLGSCWLGASFKKSRFAERFGLESDEEIPAIVTFGYISDKKTYRDSVMHLAAGSAKRKTNSEMFFNRNGLPLSEHESGKYVKALEMVRLAPSAANFQPWKMIKEENGSDTYHLYLKRSMGYASVNKIIDRADLQKIDMGIAMCHFELGAREAGLNGGWKILDKVARPRNVKFEYIATWMG